MIEDGDLTDVPAGAVGEDDARLRDLGVRRTLRDLIPDYQGPPDPLLRVRLSIRRRRSRRRALLAVGSAATAAALVAAVPAVLGLVVPGRGGHAPATDRPGPVLSAATGMPAPAPAVHPVSRGTVAGAAWRVGSTSPGGAARRCLLADGGGFDRDVVCFDEWRPGDPLSWHALVIRVGSTQATRVAGVAPAGATAVLLRAAGGTPVRAKAVRTATDPAVRFFAVVLEGEVRVRSVTPLRADDTPLAAPVTEPAASSCRPSPDNACAAPGLTAEPTG